jgi:hypothetical protein
MMYRPPYILKNDVLLELVEKGKHTIEFILFNFDDGSSGVFVEIETRLFVWVNNMWKRTGFHRDTLYEYGISITKEEAQIYIMLNELSK